ncbi:MAG: hypothetical protein HRT68_00375 [Flavobacteriaceae bacterium]|nr:hypothetical protein [Flavobacteriaceae bacterium]
MKTILICLLTLFSLQFIQAQKLAKAKDNINQSSSGYSDSDDDSVGSYDDDDSFGDELLSELAPVIVDAFIYISYGVLVETPAEYDGDFKSYLSRAPYLQDKAGDYTYDEEQAKNFRIDVHNAFLLDNANIYGNNLNVKIRPLKRFSLEIDNTFLYEKLPFDGKDELIMTSFMLNYQRLRLKQLTVSWGLGATYIGSGVNKTGFTIGTDAELFVKKPVSIQVGFKNTFINGTSVNKFNVGMKYHRKKFFLGAGYYSYNFAGQHIPTAGIGIGGYF